jgi:hypothetical protein
VIISRYRVRVEPQNSPQTGQRVSPEGISTACSSGIADKSRSAEEVAKRLGMLSWATAG